MYGQFIDTMPWMPTIGFHSVSTAESQSTVRLLAGRRGNIPLVNQGQAMGGWDGGHVHMTSDNGLGY